MDSEQRIVYLLNQIDLGLASAEELLEITALIDEDQSGSVIERIHQLNLRRIEGAEGSQYNSLKWQRTIQDILKADQLSTPAEKETQPIVHRVHFLRPRWFRYAAAIVIILGISAYFY